MNQTRSKREQIGELRLDYEKAKGQKKLDLLTEIRNQESKLKNLLKPKSYEIH